MVDCYRKNVSVEYAVVVICRYVEFTRTVDSTR